MAETEEPDPDQDLTAQIESLLLRSCEFNQRHKPLPSDHRPPGVAEPQLAPQGSEAARLPADGQSGRRAAEPSAPFVAAAAGLWLPRFLPRENEPLSTAQGCSLGHTPAIAAVSLRPTDLSTCRVKMDPLKRAHQLTAGGQAGEAPPSCFIP